MAEPLAIYDSARRPHPFVEEAVELWRFRDLIALWTRRNIMLRYKRSALGMLWALLEPLVLMTILSVVFSSIFRFDIRNYPIYLLPGLMLWDFFRRSSLQIIGDTMATQSLAERIHLPRSCFAVAAVLSYLFHWVISLLPIFAIMLILGHPFTWSLLILPVAMAPVVLFALGVGLVVATLGATFYDIQLTYQVGLTAWMYATPIIYPLEIVAERFQPYFRLNPMYHFCELFRRPIFEGQLASAESWLMAVLCGGVMALGGWWAFTRWRNVFDYRS